MLQRRRGRLIGARRITVTAMLMILSLFCLYLSSIIPTNRITFYVLSSLFVAALLIEGEQALAWLHYIGVSILALVLLQDKLRLVPYLALFGNYGIIKYHLEKIRNAPTRIIGKLVYFNFTLIIMYLSARQILMSEIKVALPVWVIMLAAQVLFLIYDYVFTRLIEFYDFRIRKYVIR